MSAVGAIVIFVGSYVLVTAVFPNYFMEVQEAGRVTLGAQGLSEQAIQAQLDAMAPMQTPLANSLTGGIATIITGLIESLILAAFIKAKAPAPRLNQFNLKKFKDSSRKHFPPHLTVITLPPGKYLKLF